MLQHCNSIYYKFKTILRPLLPAVIGACMAFMPEAGGAKVKGIALLGDSLTWLGGDSCTNPKGWSYYLRSSEIAEDITVYARSGATWTNSPASNPDTESYSEVLDPDNVIFNQILRLGKQIEKKERNIPETIIIMAGTNDAWFADRFPLIFSEEEELTGCDSGEVHPSDATSLAGSVRLGCGMLKKMAPESTLLIVTPPQNAKVTADEIHHLSDIIETAATDKGARVARADRDCKISHEREASDPLYTYDGIHTNQSGAKLLADFILSQLTNDN